MASKGTFNQGWWNCFWSFAAELLSVNKFADGICISVLEGAGITRKEAQYQLDNPQTPLHERLTPLRFTAEGGATF